MYIIRKIDHFPCHALRAVADGAQFLIFSVVLRRIFYNAFDSFFEFLVFCFFFVDRCILFLYIS